MILFSPLHQSAGFFHGILLRAVYNPVAAPSNDPEECFIIAFEDGGHPENYVRELNYAAEAVESATRQVTEHTLDHREAKLHYLPWQDELRGVHDRLEEILASIKKAVAINGGE